MATEEDKLSIELDNEELNPDVVVATLELKEPILELNPLFVVATEEDNEPILELKSFVVVATELDSEPILVDILELNVLYPVVPVIKTWTLPDITVSVLSLFLIVVSIELVNVFKLPVADSIDVNWPLCVELVESFELV